MQRQIKRVSPMICVPVLQTQMVLSLSRISLFCLSSLIVTSMQVNTTQFYLLPLFQCFFKKEDELNLQASDSGPSIEMCSFVALYKTQWAPSVHGCPLAYTLRWWQPEMFHARPFTSTKQCHGTEVSVTTLNYMVEYLFIICTANIYASANFNFTFFKRK